MYKLYFHPFKLSLVHTNVIIFWLEFSLMLACATMLVARSYQLEPPHAYICFNKICQNVKCPYYHKRKKKRTTIYLILYPTDYWYLVKHWASIVCCFFDTVKRISLVGMFFAQVKNIKQIYIPFPHGMTCITFVLNTAYIHLCDNILLHQGQFLTLQLFLLYLSRNVHGIILM